MHWGGEGKGLPFANISRWWYSVGTLLQCRGQWGSSQSVLIFNHYLCFYILSASLCLFVIRPFTFIVIPPLPLLLFPPLPLLLFPPLPLLLFAPLPLLLFAPLPLLLFPLYLYCYSPLYLYCYSPLYLYCYSPLYLYCYSPFTFIVIPPSYCCLEFLYIIS